MRQRLIEILTNKFLNNLKNALINKVWINEPLINKVVVVKLIMVLFLSSELSATNLTLSFSQNATNNLFQTRFAEKDYLSTLAFSLDGPISPFSFFTEGEYYYLYRNPEVSYYTQYFGLDYLYAFNERTAFYMGIKGGGNLYRSSFSDFNYFDLGLLASIKSYLSPVSILKLDYSLDYKKYRFSSFDNLSHLVTLNVDRYFQTKTTLKLGITWGYKQFIHPGEEVTSSALTTSSAAEARAATGATSITTETKITAATTEIGTTITPASKTIIAGSNFPPYLTQSRGKGSGGYQMGRRGSYFKKEISEAERGIQIFSLSGLIAQGIGERIGLRFSAMQQWTLSGQNPFNSIEEYYLIENPSYDLYTWNGYIFSGQLTVEAPTSWQLKVGYTWSRKVFPGIEAIDGAGSSLEVWRKDERSLWEARLEKDLASFSIILAYAYGKNNSNDYLFEWQSHFLSLSIGWNLTWRKI